MKNPIETRQWHDLFHRMELAVAWHELDGYIVQVRGAARPIMDTKGLWRLRCWVANLGQRTCTRTTWRALQMVNARREPTLLDVGNAKRLCVNSIMGYSPGKLTGQA
jgi:hypothetical protein